MVRVQSLDKIRIGKLKKAGLLAEMGRATKEGVEDLGKVILEQAKLNAKKTIRFGRPHNRPHRGEGADSPSYFDGFYMEVKGSRLKWSVEIGNKAPDQHIQEGGRRRGVKGPNMRNARQRRIIRDWAQSRGLLGGAFRELKQRRLKSGRYAKKKAMSPSAVLFAIVKSIRKRGRPAHKNMERAGLKIQQESKAYNAFAKRLAATLR